MNILLSLFYLTMNIAKKNVLPQDPFTVESSHRDFVKGYDMRSNQYNEPSLERLIDLHEKHNLLLKLSSGETPFLEKETLAKEYLEEPLTMASNLLAGGLTEDWDFEI